MLLLFYALIAFLPIMLESMIDINVKKRLETISRLHLLRI